MPVCGKKLYRVYLSEEETAYIKTHIHSLKGQGGFSQLIDEVVKNIYSIMKERDLKEGRKLTWKRLIKLMNSDIKKS